MSVGDLVLHDKLTEIERRLTTLESRLADVPHLTKRVWAIERVLGRYGQPHTEYPGECPSPPIPEIFNMMGRTSKGSKNWKRKSKRSRPGSRIPDGWGRPRYENVGPLGRDGSYNL